MYFLFVILHPEGTYFPGRHEIWMSHMGSFRIWNLEFLLSPQAAMSSFELDRLWVCKRFIRHAARFSAWHPFWHLICSGKYGNILTVNLFQTFTLALYLTFSAFLSAIFCDILSDFPSDSPIWHSFGLPAWRVFWASVWRSTWAFCHSIQHRFWHFFGAQRIHSEILSCISFGMCWGPCVPTLIWSSLRARACRDCRGAGLVSVCAQIPVEFDTMFHR